METQIKSDHLKQSVVLEQAKSEVVQLQISLESERASRTTAEELLNREKDEHKKTIAKLSELEEELAMLQTRMGNHMTESHDASGNQVTESHDTSSNFTADSLVVETPDTRKVPPPLTPSRNVSTSSVTPIERSFSYPNTKHPRIDPTHSRPRKLHASLDEAPPTSTPFSPVKGLEWNCRNGTVPASRENIHSILTTLELNLTPKHKSQLLKGSKVNYVLERDSLDQKTPDMGNSRGKSLSYTMGKSLPDEALIGLRQAFELINTLSSLNVGLQDELTRVNQENWVRLSLVQLYIYLMLHTHTHSYTHKHIHTHTHT